MLWWSPTQQIGHVAIATTQQKLTELIGGVKIKIEVQFWKYLHSAQPL